jgi:hypothetical protein
MMKRALFVWFALLFVSTPAFANGVYSGQLLSVRTDIGLGVLLTFGSDATSPGNCVSTQNPDTRSMMAIDLSTDTGKAAFATALAAYLAGKNVWVIGTGECHLYGNIEGVLTIQIQSW